LQLAIAWRIDVFNVRRRIRVRRRTLAIAWRIDVFNVRRRIHDIHNLLKRPTIIDLLTLTTEL